MKNKSKAGKTYQIERNPESTPEINYKYEKHNDRLLNEVFDTPEKLVKRAVLIGKIPREDERDLIDYIDLVMGGNNFYHMTDYKIDENGTVSIPLTLKSLDGFLNQWKHEKQVEPSAPSASDQLPEELDTPEAREIFEKAIKAGFIEKSETGYKWNGSNALLSAFCGIVFCGDKVEIDKYLEEKYVRNSTLFPDSALNKLFNLKNLGQSRLQLMTPPSGYEKIKKILFD